MPPEPYLLRLCSLLQAYRDGNLVGTTDPIEALKNASDRPYK